MSKFQSSYYVNPQAIGEARLAGQVRVLPNQKAVVRLPIEQEAISVGGRSYMVPKEVMPQTLEPHLTPISSMVSRRKAEGRIMDDLYDYETDSFIGRQVNVEQEHGAQLLPQEQQRFLGMGFDPENSDVDTLRLMLKYGYMPAQHIPGTV